MGVVDGGRLYFADMRQVEGTIVLTDERLVFVDTSEDGPTADSVLVSEMRELGARGQFFEIVLAPGPPGDHNTWWLQVGPKEHLAPFATLIMSSPNYTGDR